MERFVDMAQLCSSVPHRMKDLGILGHMKRIRKRSLATAAHTHSLAQAYWPLSSLSYLPPALELV